MVVVNVFIVAYSYFLKCSVIVTVKMEDVHYFMTNRGVNKENLEIDRLLLQNDSLIMNDLCNKILKQLLCSLKESYTFQYEIISH